MKPRLSLNNFADGILNGDRIVLGQAITLIESRLQQDQEQASLLLDKMLPYTGKSLRIGLTGIPGVGKSTFIEVFGKYITGQGKKLAVLTIDPSSPLTNGSILGDKTRMEELSKDPLAFIRPTASSHALGGVAHKTREVMFLCEAAGYEIILVETVGVGQSEFAVKNMVDFFLLLMLTGAGDELQGIKKGIMEIADAIVITKADGENVKSALQAQAMYREALHLFVAPESGWQPKVLTSSAYTGEGIEDIWNMILKYQDDVQTNGFFDSNRSHQNISWFREYFTQLLHADLRKFSSIQTLEKKLEEAVANLAVSSQAAAIKLLEAYHQAIRGSKS
ncbi:MAG: methylmalonyl Co-A mutase-associated GTPase MeaB [Marivirga sp.]|nr:methylmalonyl Co-A mutase-associated GTPase MeaB [Marivirga sp.]